MGGNHAELEAPQKGSAGAKSRKDAAEGTRLDQQPGSETVAEAEVGPQGETWLTFLPLSSLIADPEIQKRTKLDPAVVREYQHVFETTPSKFPAIEVVCTADGKYLIADGFLRYLAAGFAGIESLRAIVRNGTRRDAHLLAVASNSTHGLPRSDADRQRAVTFLLADPELNELDNEVLAQLAGVDENFVIKTRLKRQQRVRRRYFMLHRYAANHDMGDDAPAPTIAGSPKETRHYPRQRNSVTGQFEPAGTVARDESVLVELGIVDAFPATLSACHDEIRRLRARVAALEGRFREFAIAGTIEKE